MRRISILLILTALAYIFRDTLMMWAWIPAVLALGYLLVLVAAAFSRGRAAGDVRAALSALMRATQTRIGLTVLILSTVGFAQTYDRIHVRDAMPVAATVSATQPRPTASFDFPTAAPAARASDDPVRVQPGIDNVVRPQRLRVEDIQIVR